MKDKKKYIIPLAASIINDNIAGWVPPSIVKPDFTTVEGVKNIVIFLLNTLIGLSALVAVVMIIISGYLFITAAGEPEKIQKAQGTLTAAVVGMIIVFLAKVVIEFLLDIILR